MFDGLIVTRDGIYAGLGTGLDLIRALFEQRLATALVSAGSQSVAVLFIDLDRFKEINDDALRIRPA